ncbi:MAG: bifunctional folylpolyglutamate synthase/dihydrofolate synthase [Acidimicrobiaceae bacterium]|nr:bifunctional folylpolyglutamate synthase/dihydrofolate synthase [Acidimicrobiaceae bacterium]
MARPSGYDDALRWLETHTDYEWVNHVRREIPTLEPVRRVLELFADPHRDYPVIHLTGTNGKGTTSTLTSALALAAGLRVGTFTSPDLHSVNERIAVNGESIDDEALADLLARLCDAERVSEIVLTRFELLTVAALLHFSDEGVDLAVIEVGVGGTWDSTNVVDGVVNVLTNVDLDHTAILGPTISAIAEDKVGIFRPEATIVLATQNAIVVEIAEARARELGATLWRLGRDFEVEENDLALGGRLITVRTPYSRYEDLLVSLHGSHQGVNAATALVAFEAFLGRSLGEELVAPVFAGASMPGRLEVLSHRPTLVVDGAHNPAGVRRLVETLESAFLVEGDRRCVLGMLGGREVDDMVEPLVASGFVEFFCAPPRSPRAMSGADVAAAIRRAGGVARDFSSVALALSHARELSGDEDLVVAAGSLYLVAEVREAVLGITSRHLDETP